MKAPSFCKTPIPSRSDMKHSFQSLLQLLLMGPVCPLTPPLTSWPPAPWTWNSSNKNASFYRDCFISSHNYIKSNPYHKWLIVTDVFPNGSVSLTKPWLIQRHTYIYINILWWLINSQSFSLKELMTVLNQHSSRIVSALILSGPLSPLQDSMFPAAPVLQCPWWKVIRDSDAQCSQP